MIQLASLEKCTGCMACASACPRQAIGTTQDPLGGNLPRIDNNLCVDCGLCQRVCPETNGLKFAEPAQAYAVWSLDPQNRKTSTSGGAAAVFYEQALKQGYWICGAEYASCDQVVHTLRNDFEAIAGYKQSKYVFSELGQVYRQIKERLDEGGKVLMISLPCKIAGLLGYLQKPYENLITVDIVCHGTPTGKVFKEHIQAVAPQAENGRVSFREDNEYQFAVSCDGKIRYRKMGRTDPYLAAFLEGFSYRESCYHCSYAKPQRTADITIGDFWGLGKEVPFEHPYTGAVSEVLINTEKGREFFEDCRALFFVEERPVSEAINGNAQLNAPAPRPANRDQFLEQYGKDGFEKTVKAILRPQMKVAQKTTQPP